MLKTDKYGDLELMRRMAQSDQHAFTELYIRHHQGVYNFLLSIVKVPEVAEDLLQDIFLKVWEGRKQFHITNSFQSYLYQAARNKAIDVLRRIAKDPLLEDEIRHRLSTGVYKLTYQDQDWRQYQQLLGQALDTLPPQRKLAFLLVRHEGKRYDEAARIMGISRNTLKQHLSLAVASIRKFLLEKGEIIFALPVYFICFFYL